MRCISQLGSNGNTNQINGTQSLNRNLASRSTGALMIPANNLSSTLSSNDSAQNFHNYQNTSSSAHHLSYNPAQDINIKPGLLKKQGSIDKENVIKAMSEQQNEPTSVQSLNNHQNNSQQKQFHQQLRDNDSSTHGSRTIDSRYSRDKTLGLSDEDADVNNEDDEDEDEDDEDDDDADDYEENLTNDDKKFKKADDKCTCKQHNDNEQSDSSILKNHFVNQSIPINKHTINNNSVKTIDNDYSNSYKSTKYKPSSQISTHNSNYQQKFISLPIQQQQKLYSKQKNNSSDQATDNESTTLAAPALMTSTNPNKIYSRKEVITTYKEETKNTHLEEYHQTTTFYDTPAGSIEFLSSTSAPNQKPLVTSSSSKQNTHLEQTIHQPHYHEINKPTNPIYAANGLSRSTPPMGAATNQQKQMQHTLKTMKQKTTPLKNGVDDEAFNDNNSKHDDENDNDDEGKRKNFHSSSSSSINSSICNNINEPTNNSDISGPSRNINSLNKIDCVQEIDQIKNDKTLKLNKSSRLTNNNLVLNSCSSIVPIKTSPIKNKSLLNNNFETNPRLNNDNNGKHVTSNYLKTLEEDDNSELLKDKKKKIILKQKSLSQTPVVLTSTNPEIKSSQKQFSKKNKKINFADLMSLDNSNSDNDCCPDPIQAKKKETHTNSLSLNETTTFSFSINSSFTELPLAFLNETASNSSNSLSSSKSSSLDDFSFLSSNSSLSESLRSVQSNSSSTVSREATSSDKLNSKPKISKNNKTTTKNTIFIIRNNPDKQTIQMKNTNENISLETIKKNKQSSSTLPKKKSNHIQTIISSDKNNASNHSSESDYENKKTSSKLQEANGTSNLLNDSTKRKFKSLPRIAKTIHESSKHNDNYQLKSKNRKKTEPTTLMSFSFSDFRSLVNKFDLNLSASMLITYADTTPNRKTHKKKRKIKKEALDNQNIVQTKIKKKKIRVKSNKKSNIEPTMVTVTSEVANETTKLNEDTQRDLDSKSESDNSSDDGDFIIEQFTDKKERIEKTVGCQARKETDDEDIK